MPDAAETGALLEHWRQYFENALDDALPPAEQSPTRLHAAMRHASLAGGKRIRPLLVYATAHAMDADHTHADHAAVAVELIHCYSLVHDDLPAMDDDDLRRGQPTVHIAFDEATAILAGDALQSLAFKQLSMGDAPSEARITMIRTLAEASGSQGMCGGQMLDIAATGDSAIGIDALERLHAWKTGALLRASVRLGALAANADAASLTTLDRYASALGLAFQIKDDLLDIEADSATLGKTAGKDVLQDKATFPALLGVDASRARLVELSETMQAALGGLQGETAPLALLARMVVERDR